MAVAVGSRQSAVALLAAWATLSLVEGSFSRDAGEACVP